MIHQMNPICHMQSIDAAYIYNFHNRILERPASLRFDFIKFSLNHKKNNANTKFGNLLQNRKESGEKRKLRKCKGKEKYSTSVIEDRGECTYTNFSTSVAKRWAK